MGRVQVLSVGEQFEAGVRFFDFRATLKSGEWYSVHSLESERPLRYYMQLLRQMMYVHRGEVCIVTVSRHGIEQKESGTSLDSMPHLDKLWKDITEPLTSYLVLSRWPPPLCPSTGRLERGFCCS